MKQIWVWPLAVLAAVFAMVAESHAAVRIAASCSYGDVSREVSRASARDTVMVPAGSCTWSDKLTINRGINLIGAGIGRTVIRNGTVLHTALISYDTWYDRTNEPFRISGFTFDLGNNGSGIALGMSNKTAPFTIQTQIRIDNNRFANAANGSYPAIWDFGGMHGVVDGNVFDGIIFPVRSTPQVAGASWWDYFTMNFGSAASHLYFEDNTFTGVSETVAYCQFSGRYLFRYNTIATTMDSYPLFDMHGNQTSGSLGGPIDGMYSCFGGEIYGNEIQAGASEVNFLDQRGGKALVFYNNVSTSSSVAFIKVREERSDAEEPTTNAQPQHVSSSFYWGNRRNLTGPLFGVSATQVLGDIPLANRDYWYQGPGFDGTSGVGCGTLASRPASCTKGVGYWATNQSCSDLTGHVGRNPAKPISGTLYQCSAPNTWTPFFTPYTYPHPLRQGRFSSEVDPPSNLRLVQVD